MKISLAFQYQRDLKIKIHIHIQAPHFIYGIMADLEVEFVTLVSSDNFKFIILKEVASISSVLRNSQGFEEGKRVE